MHVQKTLIPASKHHWHSPWHIKLSRCSKQHVWMERTSLPFRSPPHPQCRCCRCLWTGGGHDSRFQCSWVYIQSGSKEPSSQSQPGQRLQICQWQKVQRQTLLRGKVKNNNYSNGFRRKFWYLKGMRYNERQGTKPRSHYPEKAPADSSSVLHQRHDTEDRVLNSDRCFTQQLQKDSEIGWKR